MAVIDADVECGAHPQAFAVGFQFPVVFTEGLLRPENRALVDAMHGRLEGCAASAVAPSGERVRFVAFADGGLVAARPSLRHELAAYADAHADLVEMVGDLVVTPAGEAAKNDVSLLEAHHHVLYKRRIDRHSYVVAFGGGAVLDAVGFVAATCHRGVRLIRVPTTTLAQNDAGVGVKNGVNLFGVKNFMGSFAPPEAVLNDIDFLDTLGPRDKRAGIAEAVKVALIRDGAFFHWLEANADALGRFERAAMAYQIRRCAQLHMAQIAHGGDPFESGSARPLDFGHWAAHKLEIASNHDLRHGEAVAIGIALDAQYSVLAGLLSQADSDRIAGALERIGFTLWHDALAEREPDTGRAAVLQGLADFQEHLGGRLTVTLLTGLGSPHDVHVMDFERVEAAIAWLRRRAHA